MDTESENRVVAVIKAVTGDKLMMLARSAAGLQYRRPYQSSRHRRQRKLQLLTTERFSRLVKAPSSTNI